MNAEPQGETYKLTLTGGGLTIERDVDEATALQVVAAVMGGFKPPRPVVRNRAIAGVESIRALAPSSQLSAREYMNKFEPKRNVDKILTLAAYLSDELGHKSLTPDDVRREFRNASEPVPGNFARDWKWAVGNGWLAEEPTAPGEYYVTVTGREALEAKFSDEVKKSTGVNRITRRRRGARRSARAEAAAEE